jgi:pyridoxal phosphate enzyme (YggS family)
MSDAGSHYQILRAKIPATVRVIAVSKKHTLASIEEVYDAGCRDFGENYVQEAIAKIQQLQHKQICWHFLGRLQTNKVKEVAQYFDCVHSINRAEIALRLNHACAQLGKVMPVFIQVNLDCEAQKSGVVAADLPALIEAIVSCKNLVLQGLMLIPSQGDTTGFARLRALRDLVGLPGCRLSMGMSSDYWLAVAEGATEVRIGEAIFGSRMALTV